MCIAVPMKIVSIDEQSRMGKALYSGNEMNINLSLVSPRLGDYVLVHAGCAIEIVKKESAEEILGLFEELEEAAGGGKTTHETG